jgi:hypothetical protein
VTPAPPRHERIAHTAELALRLEADSPAEVYAEACRALGAMLREETGSTPVGKNVSRTVAVDAVDADALLVDLLNELIYLAETERWLRSHWRGRAPTAWLSASPGRTFGVCPPASRAQRITAWRCATLESAGWPR